MSESHLFINEYDNTLCLNFYLNVYIKCIYYITGRHHNVFPYDICVLFVLFHQFGVISVLAAQSGSVTCDFESADICNYTQDTSDGFDWKWRSGGTGTGSTGPPNDHTQQSSGG